MLLCILACNIVPGLRYAYLLYSVFCLVWVIFAIFANTKLFYSVFIAPNSVQYSIYLWILINLCFLFTSHLALKPFLYYLLISFTLSIFWYYFKLGDRRLYKLFVIFSFLCFIIISINTIYELYSNQMLSRILASGDRSYTAQYAGFFIGGYTSVYSISILTICLVGLIKNRIMREKTFFIALILLFCFLIYKSSYVMAIIFTIIFSFLTLIKSDNTKKNLFIISILIIGIFSLYPLVIQQLYTLSYIVDSIIISSRLKEIADFLSSFAFTYGTDLYARIDLYTTSWKSFCSSPIIGVGYSVYREHGMLGGHSDILDYFGHLGIIGGVSLLIVLFTISIRITRFIDNKRKEYIYWCCIICYFLIILFNTGLEKTMLTIIFFVVPLLIQIVDFEK